MSTSSSDAIAAFKSIFGFEPQGDSQIVCEVQVKMVHGHLQALATILSEIDRKERALQADLEGTEGFDSLLALRERARQAAEEIRAAKGTFWQARCAAKNLGFIVYDKYTDYLPDSARRTEAQRRYR